MPKPRLQADIRKALKGNELTIRELADLVKASTRDVHGQLRGMKDTEKVPDAKTPQPPKWRFK